MDTNVDERANSRNELGGGARSLQLNDLRRWANGLWMCFVGAWWR